MLDMNMGAKIGLVGIFLIILSQIVIGCTTSLPKQHIVGPKTYKNKVDIRINGFRRTYLVHIPPGYNPQNPLPLVVVIHGAFDTGKGMEKFSGFSDLADREGFVVLYPNGMGILGFLQHWNAGHCCGKAADDNLDDVGFVAAAIEDVSARLTIDRSRVYMVGFSNGGMLTYRFAAERGDLLAAAAPMAASIGGKSSADAPEWRIPEPVQPLSMIIFHGLADDDIRYEGGVSLHRGGTRAYLSVEESVEFWVMSNGCNPRAASTQLYEDKVNLKSWGICRDDTEVALYLIKDWGHVWPGKYFTSDLAENDPLRDFDAAEIIWDFLKISVVNLNMKPLIIVFMGAYLAGSVNFAILLFKALGKDDPRAGFSGNPGATNVYRQAGYFWAVLVLILDMSRALGVAFIALHLVPMAHVPWAGLGLILGNRFPCFHGLRGGKGVANYLGFTMIIAPVAAGLSVLGWFLAYSIWRTPFIGSFVMVLILATGTIVACEYSFSAIPGVATTAALIYYNHKSNVLGMLRQRGNAN